MAFPAPTGQLSRDGWRRLRLYPELSPFMGQKGQPPVVVHDADQNTPLCFSGHRQELLVVDYKRPYESAPDMVFVPNEGRRGNGFRYTGLILSDRPPLSFDPRLLMTKVGGDQETIARGSLTNVMGYVAVTGTFPPDSRLQSLCQPPPQIMPLTEPSSWAFFRTNPEATVRLIEGSRRSLAKDFFDPTERQWIQPPDYPPVLDFMANYGRWPLTQNEIDHRSPATVEIPYFGLTLPFNVFTGFDEHMGVEARTEGLFVQYRGDRMGVSHVIPWKTSLTYSKVSHTLRDAWWGPSGVKSREDFVERTKHYARGVSTEASSIVSAYETMASVILSNESLTLFIDRLKQQWPQSYPGTRSLVAYDPDTDVLVVRMTLLSQPPESKDYGVPMGLSEAQLRAFLFTFNGLAPYKQAAEYGTRLRTPPQVRDGGDGFR